MKRSLLAFFAAVALSATVLVAAPPTPTNASSSCLGAVSQSHHDIVTKSIAQIGGSNYYFDAVRGDATLTPLDPCAFIIGSDGAGACVLLANLQAEFATKDIIQIGWCQQNSTAPFVFVYTPNPSNGGVSSPFPTVNVTARAGDRYRGMITRYYNRYGNIVALYTLYDLTTGYNDSVEAPWIDNVFTQAWWGDEAIDSHATPGTPSGYAGQNMAYMGYSTTSLSSWYYRSGIPNTYCTGLLKYCNGMWREDSSTTMSIGTWVYGGDMLNVTG